MAPIECNKSFLIQGKFNVKMCIYMAISKVYNFQKGATLVPSATNNPPICTVNKVHSYIYLYINDNDSLFNCHLILVECVCVCLCGCLLFIYIKHTTKLMSIDVKLMISHPFFSSSLMLNIIPCLP